MKSKLLLTLVLLLYCCSFFVSASASDNGNFVKEVAISTTSTLSNSSLNRETLEAIPVHFTAGYYKNALLKSRSAYGEVDTTKGSWDIWISVQLYKNGSQAASASSTKYNTEDYIVKTKEYKFKSTDTYGVYATCKVTGDAAFNDYTNSICKGDPFD